MPRNHARQAQPGSTRNGKRLTPTGVLGGVLARQEPPTFFWVQPHHDILPNMDSILVCVVCGGVHARYTMGRSHLEHGIKAGPVPPLQPNPPSSDVFLLLPVSASRRSSLPRPRTWPHPPSAPPGPRSLSIPAADHHPRSAHLMCEPLGAYHSLLLRLQPPSSRIPRAGLTLLIFQALAPRCCSCSPS